MLRELAEFWKIPYSTSTSSQSTNTVFATSASASVSERENRPLIIAPRGFEEAQRIADQAKLELTKEDSHIKIPVGPDTSVSINADLYRYSGPNIEYIVRSDNVPVISKIRETNTYLLSLDLLAEYRRTLYGGLEDPPNWKFKLASRLPFSYQSIPRFIRDRSFRSPEGLSEIREDRLGPVECLRTVFLASIVIASGPVPRIRFWRRGKSYAVAVTHDVETAEGLTRGVPSLLKVERELRIQSTWNLPSDRYPFSSDELLPVMKSEIGGHDTKHDGRLVLVGKHEKVQRLEECRQSLTDLSGREVRGFRSPLLQHSSELIESIAAAGYDYDSSCPSWEMLSPTSMRPHGVGTVFPFITNGIVEIPVSLPQDHQMIRVAGQTPASTVDHLQQLSRWIRGLGGACVLLVHPDYEFGMADNQSEYRRLLDNFASDPTCDIMTLGELSDWWRFRSKAGWDFSNGHPFLNATSDSDALGSLQLELVTGYGPNGFTTEVLS